MTKIWPEDLFPLQPVGRMVLNKNPDNFFNENEQLAFCPALIVPGKQTRQHRCDSHKWWNIGQCALQYEASSAASAFPIVKVFEWGMQHVGFMQGRWYCLSSLQSWWSMLRPSLWCLQR